MAETVTPLRPGIGHNLPPEEVIDPHDPAILQARLERDYAPLFRRFSELELGSKKIGLAIKTEAEAQKVLDWQKEQCDDAIKQAKTAHDVEKRPFLVCGRVVDEFFRDRVDRFRLAIKPAKDRYDTFVLRLKAEQQAKEAEQRRLARIEAERHAAEQRRLQEEAQKAEAAGNRRAATDLAHQADQEQQRADHHAAVAEAPGAPFRFHGELSRATTYTVTRWKFEIADPAALPARYWKPDEELIQADIDAGVRAIPGVEISSFDEVRSRSC